MTKFKFMLFIFNIASHYKSLNAYFYSKKRHNQIFTIFSHTKNFFSKRFTKESSKNRLGFYNAIINILKNLPCRCNSKLRMDFCIQFNVVEQPIFESRAKNAQHFFRLFFQKRPQVNSFVRDEA